MKHRLFSKILIPSLLLALVLSALGITPAHAAGIRYVKPAASGSGDCSSWANACDLPTALTNAVAGDEIWAAAGIYKPTSAADRSATFQLEPYVAVYGGFDGVNDAAFGDRDPAANVTILSGDLLGNDNSNVAYDEPTRADNACRVVTGASWATLDGFTVTAGHADTGCSSYNGGGMFNTSSSPTVTNVTFSSNLSLGYGGGMSNSSSNPILTNVTFSGNSAGFGAGMSNSSSSPILTNVTFSGNSAQIRGGGMLNISSSNPILTNVNFSGNLALESGGGMYNFTSSPMLTNVTFSGNSAGQVSNSVIPGGGMYNNRPLSSNVAFGGNPPLAISGGGMYNSISSSPTLTNVTFSGNLAELGGGMYNQNSSNPTLTNVTFSGNSALEFGGGMYNGASNPTIHNAIFWGDTAPDGAQIYDLSSSPVVSDSIIQGGYAGGTNIITTDPLLGALDNYGGPVPTIPLLPGSSAIDAGSATYCTAGKDQRGVSYVGACDLGAFESQGFSLAITSGNHQSVPPNASFPTPLAVSVTANTPIEPVNGGVVTFTPPATGASAALTGNPAAITGGSAGVNATANDTSGPYTVTASASGATSMGFSLANRNIPVLTWADPVDIDQGTPLGDAQLNATADVVGTFTYTPAVGTYLRTGTHTLHVDFVPVDAVNYTTTSREVSLTVNDHAIFADVPVGYWARTFIERLYFNHISGGCSLNPLNYCPDQNVTRAQLAVILLRSKYGAPYLPPDVGTGTGFADVPANYWVAAWIKQLAAEGITAGCGNGNFCPNKVVTRAELAVLLLRAKHGNNYIPPAASGLFADAPANYWAAPWIEQLVTEGITSGCGGGNYCPNQPVTRAEMAVFLVTAFNLP